MTAILPILERRRIEAELLREVYATLRAALGEAEAKRLVAESVRRSAIAQARAFAATAEGGAGLQGFKDIQKHWTAGGALEIEVLRSTPDAFDFNVTRCRYAEMYRDMGLAEIGPLLSCQRDGAFCEGYDPKLTLERTQTLMGGADHCDFRYRYADGAPAAPSGE